MDLYKEWQKYNKEHFSNLETKKEDIMTAITNESSSVIHELKKRVKYKIYWIALFILLFAVGMLFSLHNAGIILILGIFMVLYSAGFIKMLIQYRKMDDVIDPKDDTLTTMKNHVLWMKSALKFENLFGWIGVPTMIVGGILLPQLYRGTSFIEILTDTKQISIIFACLIVLVPLANLLGNKMNDIAYGNHLRKLEENIGSMESLEQ